MTDRPGDTEALPPPRTPGRYRVALVCLGNICRSPMAHVVLADQVAAAGLDDRVEVVSAGTAGWHVGEPMDERAAATLARAGHDPTRHRARQFEPDWHQDCDLVLVMDRSNLADVGGETPRVRLFRAFDPENPGGEVPDPYYGGEQGFTEVMSMVERTSTHLVRLLSDAVGP
ncbi:low molecular weight protein-tyrosine-phosphatase [Nocardioides sp. 616]|uniref:low molecular weight protein-tyrosine-phosphatase n=1 Tax=Nocardioides sp. 616 TaxID=2268090 RepID=UPI000CE36F71|nr:low molecular weight protein-tyrosine-phosphatase [Nocardioides sp. 616]